MACWFWLLSPIISCRVQRDSVCWQIQIRGAENLKMKDLEDGTYPIKLLHLRNKEMAVE